MYELLLLKTSQGISLTFCFNPVAQFFHVQDFKKILNKTFCEREENLRTVLHKNLWIEAQVKLFSMKYELQLARTEIEILKHNLYAKGRPSQLF